MRREILNPNWFIELAKVDRDLQNVMPLEKKPVPSVEAALQLFPPFRGKSRKPLTKQEACTELECCMSFLDKQIRRRMLHVDPKGRLIRIPEEEIQNYRDRARFLHMERYAKEA